MVGEWGDTRAPPLVAAKRGDCGCENVNGGVRRPSTGEMVTMLSNDLLRSVVGEEAAEPGVSSISMTWWQTSTKFCNERPLVSNPGDDVRRPSEPRLERRSDPLPRRPRPRCLPLLAPPRLPEPLLRLLLPLLFCALRLRDEEDGSVLAVFSMPFVAAGAAVWPLPSGMADPSAPSSTRRSSFTRDVKISPSCRPSVPLPLEVETIKNSFHPPGFF
mmetsp:Transcript_14465/g.56881  ORF Transcript_14465/g.56881 Transcript_14465/m.56881 type:complete len:216 (+) Transcript_14465:714-1361(+)